MKQPGPARRIAIILAVTVLALVALYLFAERPWVSDKTRIERCAKLRSAIDDSTSNGSDYAEIRAFCALEAANNNLNHKGGMKRSGVLGV